MDETPPFIGFLSPHMRRTPSLQKDAEGACATSVDAGGASAPSPNRPVRATPSPKRMPRAHAQHQWTLGAHQTPSPNRPVRATPSPKRMLRAHAQLEWTLGAHQTPFPKRPVRATPSPYPPPPSLYKGVTDRAQTQSSSEPLSLHPLGQVKIILVNFGKLQVSLICTCKKIKLSSFRCYEK